MINNDANLINVNMADMKIASAPSVMRTVLGSCIGVLFYEPRMKLGGLIHIMLPEPSDTSNPNVAKFATIGIPALLEGMQKEGAVKKNIICKICGGAKMFAGFSANSVTDIGSRNQAAVIDTLGKLGVRVNAKDLGGTTGRKIVVDLADGSVKISHFNVGEKVI